MNSGQSNNNSREKTAMVRTHFEEGGGTYYKVRRLKIDEKVKKGRPNNFWKKNSVKKSENMWIGRGTGTG